MDNNLKNINCNDCSYCNSSKSSKLCNYCNCCDFCSFCNSCDYCKSCNFCDYCIRLRMSENMLFCVGGEDKRQETGYQKSNMVFNVQVTPEEFNKIVIPRIKLPVTKWVSKKDISDNGKEDNSDYKSSGGYLKKLSYKDAWREAWSELDDAGKNEFKTIPHFNKKLFFEITSIDIDKEVVEMTIAEISEALGKNVRIIK